MREDEEDEEDEEEDDVEVREQVLGLAVVHIGPKGTHHIWA